MADALKELRERLDGSHDYRQADPPTQRSYRIVRLLLAGAALAGAVAWLHHHHKQRATEGEEDDPLFQRF